MDGLDELAPGEIPPVAAWLESFLATYPGNHVVAAGPVRGYDGLARAGLAPVAIAPWTEHEQRQFLSRWGSAWQKSILPSLPKNRMVDLDPALISGWLLGVVRGLTPLEITLRVWAAYAGDSRGHRTSDNLDAYLARFLSPDERQITEVTAMTWIQERQGGVPERALHRGTPVSDMVEAGVLVRRREARLSFFQPGVGAYLAARGFASSGMPSDFAWEGWTPAESTLHWIAALGDVTAIAEQHLRNNNDPLSSALLTCAGWLKDAPAKAPWRPYVLRAVASLIQDPNRPYGLRLRALHALAAAHEATVVILFRRLLTADEPSSRILAALGLGAARDEEAVPALLQATTQDRELFVRQAACLALAGIGTQPALEGLGQALLTGDEGVRLAAGEGLACHPDEGYAMLRDALEMDNLLTRRAAVFGLARVPEAWALEALEKVQVDDGQWVVRGAAAEAAGRRKNPPWKVVTPLHELAELPWLVAYAAREGLGVAPGRPALEMLRRVLASGTTEEKLAALDAIAWSGTEEFALELDAALQSDDQHMRDAAFESRWRMAAPRDGHTRRSPTSELGPAFTRSSQEENQAPPSPPEAQCFGQLADRRGLLAGLGAQPGIDPALNFVGREIGDRDDLVEALVSRHDLDPILTDGQNLGQELDQRRVRLALNRRGGNPNAQDAILEKAGDLRPARSGGSRGRSMPRHGDRRAACRRACSFS